MYMKMMATLNVRLGPEEQRIVRALQEEGIEVSAVVREALRAKYLEMSASRTKGDVRRLLAEISAMPGADVALVDTRDRKVVREHIRRKLLR
jgi:hypothetical protein